MDLVAAYNQLISAGADLLTFEGMSPDEVIYLAERVLANQHNRIDVIQDTSVEDQVFGIVQNFLAQYRDTVLARLQAQERAREVPGQYWEALTALPVGCQSAEMWGL